MRYNLLFLFHKNVLHTVCKEKTNQTTKFVIYQILSTKTVWVYFPKSKFSFSSSDICHFVIALLIVYLAGFSGLSCSRSFEYFLKSIISHFTCRSCLWKKYLSLDINSGIWPTVTKSVLTNVNTNLSCISDCGSTSCLVIKIEPTGASQNDLKIWSSRA